MQVYVVTAGWDYEGIDCVALYDCKSAAHACAERMKEQDGYDWAEVNLQTVHMESALVA
jgi:hypothetical protein